MDAYAYKILPAHIKSIIDSGGHGQETVADQLRIKAELKPHGYMCTYDSEGFLIQTALIDDKIVGDFMGIVLHKDGKYWLPDGDIAEIIWFKTSWDSLMPVVEKIDSIGYNVVMNNTSCSIYQRGEEHNPICSNVYGVTPEKKYVVYKTVLQFIKTQNNV